jgi:plasmid stabilization system protein ParE
MPKSLEFVLEFSSQAREDVREVVLWYRNEQEGLEDRFLFSLKASTDSLIKNPLIYQVNFLSIRSMLMKRFPYRIYYSIEDDMVLILGVIHTKRSPKLIRKRIK